MQNAKHVFGEIKGLLCELSELGFVIWKRRQLCCKVCGALALNFHCSCVMNVWNNYNASENASKPALYHLIMD